MLSRGQSPIHLELSRLSLLVSRSTPNLSRPVPLSGKRLSFLIFYPPPNSKIPWKRVCCGCFQGGQVGGSEGRASCRCSLPAARGVGLLRRGSARWAQAPPGPMLKTSRSVWPDQCPDREFAQELDWACSGDGEEGGTLPSAQSAFSETSCVALRASSPHLRTAGGAAPRHLRSQPPPSPTLGLLWTIKKVAETEIPTECLNSLLSRGHLSQWSVGRYGGRLTPNP